MQSIVTLFLSFRGLIARLKKNNTKFGYFSVVLLATLATACGQWQGETSIAHEIHATNGSISSSLSSDGRYNLVSTLTQGIYLWDRQQNQVKYQWAHQATDNNLVLLTAFAPDNSYAITADNHSFVLWQLATGQAAGYISIEQSKIRDVAIANQGRSILVGQSDGKASFITTSDGNRLEFLGHSEKINTVDLSDNGRYALTGSNDNTAYLWDTQTGQGIHQFNHQSRVTKVAFDQGRRYVFTADSKNQALIWDLVTGQKVSRLQHRARQKIFTSVRFNRAGTLLVTGSPSREISLWQVATGKLLQSWRVKPKENSKNPSAVVYSVAFLNDDQQIISTSSAGITEVWSVSTDALSE